MEIMYIYDLGILSMSYADGRKCRLVWEKVKNELPDTLRKFLEDHPNVWVTV